MAPRRIRWEPRTTMSCSGVISTKDILADIDGYAWIAHAAVNPATGSERLKRSWLEAKDGRIFGAGYCVPDSNARDATSCLIILYEHAPHPLSQLRAETNPTLLNSLHIRQPDWTSATPVRWATITAEMQVNDMLALENEQNAWVMYKAVNLPTGGEDEMRVWPAMHDGYVFG